MKGQPAPHTDTSSYQNTAGETRFHCFSFPSLTSLLPFPFFFATPKVNTLCSDCCPDTASQAGFNSNPCFQSSTRWSVKDFQPCSQAGSQRGQGLVHRAMCFLPCSSKWEGMEETDVENAPPHPCSPSLRSCNKQIWALFRCGGNDCLVLLMEKGCWFWQWGYHVAMQTHKAGGKQILVLSLAIFLTISRVKTSQGTLVGFWDAANKSWATDCSGWDDSGHLPAPCNDSWRATSQVLPSQVSRGKFYLQQRWVFIRVCIVNSSAPCKGINPPPSDAVTAKSLGA